MRPTNNEALIHLGLDCVVHKPGSTALTPQAAEQYLSTKPAVRQCCGRRQSLHSLAHHHRQRSIFYKVRLYSSSQAILSTNKSCLFILSSKLCKEKTLITLQAAELSDFKRLRVLGNPSENPNKLCMKGPIMDSGMKARILFGDLKDLKSNISSLLLWIQMHASINL